METIYIGNTLINDIFLGSQRIDDAFTPTIDNDAYNFLVATNLYLQQPATNAINYLATNLKSKGIWNKLYLAYPFVGGTATTHRVNLINTGSFQLFFTGSWTHNSNGITGNGTNTFTTSSFFYQNVSNFDTNGSIGVYSRTSGQSGYDFGDGGSGAQHALIIRYTDGFYYPGLPVSAGTRVANTNGTGSYSISIGAGDNPFNVLAYKNGVKVFDASGGAGAASGQPSIGAARNTDVPAGAEDFSNRNYAWAFIGQGLTPQQHVDLNTIIQTYQSILGRQV